MDFGRGGRSVRQYDRQIHEFLNLKDEYGERDLEEALVRRLEAFESVVKDLKRRARL